MRAVAHQQYWREVGPSGNRLTTQREQAARSQGTAQTHLECIPHRISTNPFREVGTNKKAPAPTPFRFQGMFETL